MTSWLFMKMWAEAEGAPAVELQTKVREDLTIIERAPTATNAFTFKIEVSISRSANDC